MTTNTKPAPAKQRVEHNRRGANQDPAGAPTDFIGGGNTGIIVIEQEPDGYVVRILITAGGFAVPSTLIVTPKTGLIRVDLRLSGADESHLTALLSDLEISEARFVRVRWDREDAEVWLRAESLCFGHVKHAVRLLVQEMQKALRGDVFQAMLQAAHRSEDGLVSGTEVAA